MLRFLTAGESHGENLIGIIEGFPAAMYLDEEFINNELERRQQGYGRSNRMKIENDKIKVLSGVNKGYTTGNPISFIIENRGNNIELVEITKPRPGHGDLAGCLKYNHSGARNILERASARETAMKVALGSLCKLFLREFHIAIYSHIIQIGNIKSNINYYNNLSLEDLKQGDKSPVRMLDKVQEEKAIGEIEKARNTGDTLGGIMEIIATGLPIGLGSHAHWDRKLDGKIAWGIMGIPGIKGIEFGIGFHGAEKLGSKYHDEIYYNGKFHRHTNNAGGIEAGISNGEDIVFKAIMKPIPTLKRPLRTVDLETKEETIAQFERSDTTAVPAASIVAESVLAYTLMDEFLIKFGGDSMGEIENNYENYIKNLQNR